MHFVYRIRGEGLNPTQVERAVQLSKEKYCSATLMLGKTAAISYEISINGEPLEPTS
jgi:putative redox protein